MLNRSRGLLSRIRSAFVPALLLPVALFTACSSDNDPVAPAVLAANTATDVNGGQPIVAGSAITPVPTVTLTQKGRGVVNATVRWVVSGNGRVATDSSKTDANGVASPGSWTLGNGTGTQVLTALVVGSEDKYVSFTANTVAGPVASLTAVSPVLVGVVNTDVAPLPSIRAVDQFGNPVANVAVTFSIVSGNGTITGAQQTTNATGVATVGGWKLGTIAGAQSIRASANGVSATISVNAVGAAPADFSIVAGTSETGSTGKRLCSAPTVLVRDVYGNGVALTKITFTPGVGSGTVDRDTVTTDANGFATVGSWILGTAANQTLTATTPSLPGKPLSFSVTTVPAPSYNICARFIGDAGTPRQRLAVTRAIAKWQSVIVGHVQTSTINTGSSRCFASQPVINEAVEDLLLYVELKAIDGPRGIIGQASPCYVHSPSFLTLMGFLQLDIADLDLTLNTGTLDNVFLHEIGHIIGIGTLWGQITSTYSRNLLSGAGGADPFFAGSAARAQFAALFSPYTGTPVPLENCIDVAGVAIPGCGTGTRDSHWRKAVFKNELMQGYVETVMPMSKVTVASLADLGYTVNLEAADAFSFGSALTSADAVESHGMLMMNDIADTPIWAIDKAGNRTLVRAPLNPFKRY